MALWSVNTWKLLPNKYVRKCSQAQTIANNSNSFVLYFASALIRKREANAVGAQTRGSISCSRQARSPLWLASYFTREFFEES